MKEELGVAAEENLENTSFYRCDVANYDVLAL